MNGGRSCTDDETVSVFNECKLSGKIKRLQRSLYVKWASLQPAPPAVAMSHSGQPASLPRETRTARRRVTERFALSGGGEVTAAISTARLQVTGEAGRVA